MPERVTPRGFAPYVAKAIMEGNTPETQMIGLVTALEVFEQLLIEQGSVQSSEGAMIKGYIQLINIMHAAFTGHKERAINSAKDYLKLNPNGPFAQALSRFLEGPIPFPITPVQLHAEFVTNFIWCLNCRKLTIMKQVQGNIWECTFCNTQQMNYK